jgi:hypothetical protein
MCCAARTCSPPARPSPPPPFLCTAGVYIATMMATVQTLQEKGHPYSEICNEVGGWVGAEGSQMGCEGAMGR